LTSEFDRSGHLGKGILPADKAAALRDRLARARRQLNEIVIPRLRAEERVRASFAQERMWFNAKTSKMHAAYNSQVALHLAGNLDQTALTRSLEVICKRHDVCRMSFIEEDGIVWQQVRPHRENVLSIIDLADAADDELSRTVNALVTEPFDLERGPLVRWTLIRIAPDRNVLVFSDHHSVTDGWSRQIVFEELMQLYSQFVAGASEPALPELNLGYRDFARWQRDWTESEEGRAQLAFWKTKLRDAPQRLDLATDFARPPSPSHRGGHLLQPIDKDLTQALGAVGAATGSTSFMVFLAAFIVLLYRLTGMGDLSIGTGVANRRMVDTDSIVGMLINTVVIRARPTGTLGFLSLLEQIKALSLEAFANQEAPFDQVVQVVNPIRSSSINPLHQVTFNFQNNPMPDVQLPGLKVRLERPLFNGSAKYDLYVAGWPQGGERNGNWMSDGSAVMLSWEFSLDLFEEASIRRMQAQYIEVLKQIAVDQDLSIGGFELDIGGAAFVRSVEPPAPQDLCIHGLVGAWACRTPDAIAVQYGAETLTYAELDRKSTALARDLSRLGTGGTAIGVSARRSVWLPINLLGTLKAGGAYVPLDPDLPSDLLREIIVIAGITCVLCDECDRSLFEALGVSTTAYHEQPSPTESGLLAVRDNAHAYVMFTSGSSGKPKAVAVPHRAVVRLVSNQSFADMGPKNVWLLHSPLTFDASTLEIWAPLCNGGRLVIQPDGRYSLRELGDTIRQGGVDSLWLTSGLFQIAANECPMIFSPLSQLLTGGDVVSPEAVRQVMRACPSTIIINGYGPTENTTFTCCGRITPQDLDRRSIPIGKPIRGTHIEVLDEDLRSCPLGRIGELFAGGSGLATGYLGDAEATSERFIEHPELGRLYRTGDLCRILADGRIEFVGRRDRQVKIAGHRIELAEVENRLSLLPGVAAASVVVVSKGPGDSFLRAVLVLHKGNREGTGDAALRQLKSAARSVLPAFQLPADWHLLTKLPLTSNGKIDIAALQALPASHVTPKTPSQASVTERAIAAIWTDILGIPVDDYEGDFFLLGGHSLGALRALSLIERTFGVTLSASLFFGDSSIRSISKIVVETLRNSRVTVARHARLPLIAPGPAYPTLLFVPGGWGEENEILVFAKLVRSMKIDAAKFGVRSGVTDRQAALAPNIQEYAGQLADMVSAEWDPRHTIVIGECAASTVAIALVKMLGARGTPVLGLVLLDPGDPSHLRNVITRISAPKGNQPPIIANLPVKVARYYDLLSQLPDGPISVPLHIILTKRFPNIKEVASKWTDFAGRGVATSMVPGDHNSYLREHAAETAGVLDVIVSSMAGL
jgi:amino acid adenylation domain-containing protein